MRLALVYAALVNLVLSEGERIPHLYGGRCELEGGSILVMFNPFDDQTGGFSKYNWSLDLNKKLTLTKQDHLPWIKTVAPYAKTLAGFVKLSSPTTSKSLAFDNVANQQLMGIYDTIDYVKVTDPSQSIDKAKAKYALSLAKDPSLNKYANDPELLKRIANKYPNTISHGIGLLFQYNGVDYVIHGDIEVNKRNQPIDTLHVFNPSNDTWSIAQTKGTGPKLKKGFSATMSQNQLYLVGGTPYPTTNDKSNSADDGTSDKLYILDLDKLSWSTHTIPKFKGASNGCLYKVDESQLLHSFGLFHGQPTNSSQIIDLEKYKLVADTVEEINGTIHVNVNKNATTAENASINEGEEEESVSSIMTLLLSAITIVILGILALKYFLDKRANIALSKLTP